ncbi:MAG: hypothetical protein H0X17_12020, partial [Deltaproteobacteria bacterium]|nr:hypothetical protein [Deltaproteobacteria bacterium]
AQAQRSLGIEAPASRLGVAVQGRGAAALARSLRAHGVRAVTSAQLPTSSWLRGAGLEAAILLDSGVLVRADDSQRAVAVADVDALVTLLQGDS